MKSDIKEFYAGKSIFITGATGFIGKVLLFKLLLACPDIANIFVLIRPKKSVSPDDRLEQLLSTVPFTFNDGIKQHSYKVKPIEGNLSLPELGISSESKDLLTNKVEIVFHCAASIKFDAPLKESIEHNTLATKSVIDLCKEMKALLCFVHVSTAYSNCQLNEIDEKIYPIPTDPNTIIQASKSMSTDSFNNLTKDLLDGRPNTYTFTKALAEKLVADEQSSFPMAIARPSIVFNAENEPVPGWVDNINGASGISTLASLGILRCMTWDYHAIADFVPVDKVVNALIIIGWSTEKKQNNNNESKLMIYNIVSSPVNPTSWGNLFEYGYQSAVESPTMKLVRPVIRPPKQRKTHPIYFPLTVLFSHWLFAYFVDLLLFIFGQKPIMVRLTRKMHYAFDVMGYFTQHEWKFKSNNLISTYQSLNPIDKEEFNFNMAEINWSKLAFNCHLGIRRHLLRENDDSIPAARSRMQKVIIVYGIFKVILSLILVYLLSLVIPFKLIGSIVGSFICSSIELICSANNCQNKV